LIVIAIALTIVPVLAAKKPAESEPAPIPVQVTTGKTVFISYLQSDADPGAPDLTYNEFYSLMKEWGKYELAAAPGTADLVFEIRYISGISDSQLCLSIVDPKTHFVLWPFIQHVQSSSRETSRRKNFDAAMNDLIVDLKRITTPAPPK
jgi:hypothetical protein